MEPCRTQPDASAAPSLALGVRFLDVPPMLFQQAYVWALFFSSLDIMLTWLILSRAGTEANPVARAVIHMWGLPGAIAFKFALVMLVIVICEVVGRQRPATGWSLACMAALINAVPVGWALVLISFNWPVFTRPAAFVW